ncbi:sigma-70 family RNA polymerase sigma factor [Nakamurella sp. A5-74]|uniref:Sigma-70 family RNA polymerase sigma factor n=1 Tax=Nakamurella sp. A5-74 TaxID=3158264 RepID=A0AAU8DVQ3_9ACTN
MIDQVVAMLVSRGTALTAFGHQLTHSSTEAQDLLQEAVTRILSSRRRSNAHVDDIEAYTRTVMVRTLIDAHRRDHGLDKRTDRLDETPDLPDRITGFDDSIVDRDELWEAIGQLPARQRTVLVLRYYQGASDVQIAADLDCPAGTVRSLASRALATLRERLSSTAL